MERTIVDESRVPSYNLPDPLRMADGAAVTEVAQWPARRAELLGLFAKNLYGSAPEVPVSVTGRVLSEKALDDGTAIMKQVEVVLRHGDRCLEMGVLLFLPKAAKRPVPAFLGLNFYGNHTVHPDPSIRLHEHWSPNNEKLKVTGNRASAASRGLRAYRWPVAELISRGYALATVYSGDIDPDFDDGFKNGVHGLFGDADHAVPPEERWGTIAAWAWGLSRILDYITENEPTIDATRVIAIGHSRMGKAALWAGATDTRFAAAISNDSGCGGAALHRRRFGERIAHLNKNFPHWLNARAKDYSECERDLPVDQHQLLALMAPRPLHVASAAEDLWADPKGEYLSLLHAEPVYRLLGISSKLPREQPDAGDAVGGPLSYHLRPGKHDILAEDWARFLDFADRAVH